MASVASYARRARQIARSRGIPENIFLALIRQESGFNPNARSPAGAVGLVQIHLPSHPNVSENQARDPEFALNWGADYLASQHRRFGNWRSALAAYNAGPGAVANYGGVPPYRETQGYVRTILSNAAKTNGGGGGMASPNFSGVPHGAPDLTDSILQSLSRGAAGERLDAGAQLSELVASSIAGGVGTPARAGRNLASSGASSSGGLQPAFEQRLSQLLAAVPGLKIASGYRSVDQQTRLWNAAVAKYGSAEAARKWVAPPGRSRHNHGLAADLSGDLARAHELAPRFGLVFPMPWENWHIELAGAR